MLFSFPPREQLVHAEHPDNPSTFPYPNVPVDKGACRLLGPTALVVQALMGGLVIASLIFKRHREKPMRPWRIWLFDVSKQVLGQAFVHGLNLFISDHVAHLASGNPCDLYFLNVLIDTTIGVGYIYLILHGADKVFTDHLHLKGFRSGEYGDPPSVVFWGRQAAVYVFTILTMKLLVVALFAAWPGIFFVGEWLLSWTGKSDRVQVVFVMGIFPIIMNVLQFWLIDSIVKASASMYAEENTRATDDSSRQPLFRVPDVGDDDDDDTLHPQRRHDLESPPSPQQKSSQRNDGINENKLLTSGSSSTLVEPSSINLHPYPPDRSPFAAPMVNESLSPVTPDSSSTASSTSSLRSKKSKRRSPPPPIRRPPPQLLNGPNYIISVTPSPTHLSLSSNVPSSAPLKTQPRQRPRSTFSQSSVSTVPGEPGEQAWDNWVEGNDWAEKVGEEECTGRLIGVSKATLDIWGGKDSGGATVPIS